RALPSKASRRLIPLLTNCFGFNHVSALSASHRTCWSNGGAENPTGEVFHLKQAPAGSVVVEKNVCKSVHTLRDIRSSTECIFRASSSGFSAADFKDGVCQIIKLETLAFNESNEC
uniref:Tick transposon n=1 Tax=Macrostomum lignano TaxID=282301 RepID=A0A1I8F4U4_9PLAT